MLRKVDRVSRYCHHSDFIRKAKNVKFTLIQKVSLSLRIVNFFVFSEGCVSSQLECM